MSTTTSRLAKKWTIPPKLKTTEWKSASKGATLIHRIFENKKQTKRTRGCRLNELVPDWTFCDPFVCIKDEQKASIDLIWPRLSSDSENNKVTGSQTRLLANKSNILLEPYLLEKWRSGLTFRPERSVWTLAINRTLEDRYWTEGYRVPTPKCQVWVIPLQGKLKLKRPSLLMCAYFWAVLATAVPGVITSIPQRFTGANFLERFHMT